MKWTSILLAGAFAAALPWAGAAQDQSTTTTTTTTERQVKGAAGRDIRIGIYYNMRPDCSSGPLPSIRLDSPPAHGAVTVKRGNMHVSGRRNCLAAELPAFVAIYRSKADFSGTDEVVLEINTHSGKTVKQKIKIIVEEVKARSI
jgi:hypothetical protein